MLLKLLSITRWTAHKTAVDAIVNNHVLLIETQEDIHATTHDEYKLKAGGCLNSLEKLNTLFGLRLAHAPFGAIEQVSLLLQGKEVAMQEALPGVDAAKMYFRKLRSEEEFDHFYSVSVEIAEQHSIGQTQLLRYRCCPRQFQNGAALHQYVCIGKRLLYQHVFLEACGLLKSTSFDTISDAINSNRLFKEMLPSVHKLLHSYKTKLVTSATSELTFSALRNVF